MQKILLTQGCPNGCAYCYEPKKEFKTFAFPDILEKEAQFLDMNFLSNPEAVKILKWIPKGHYELVCGLDFRRLTPEIALLLKEKGFYSIRWAWDYGFGMQQIQKRTWQMLVDAGFKSSTMQVFILANWKIPISDCLKKLDILKVWNVQVADCCFDGGYKIARPKDWTPEQIKRFRALCRWHNKLIRHHGFDPEFGKKDRFAWKGGA